ncbi:MAG: IS630 family transposase [Paracoccus sp. (in: a-proteobacteria)]
MPAKVPLRPDYTAAELRAFAAQVRDAGQSRRLLSLAAVMDGMSRGDAAGIGGMDRQTLRDWVHRFNEEGPDGLIDRKAPGPRHRLTADQRDELARLVETGPDPEADGVVRWRRVDLQRVIRDRFGVSYHERHVGHILHQLGFSHISARPQHPAQDAEVIEGFKKNFADRLKTILKDLPEDTPVEIWFQDEMRLGQKNSRVRQWARKGTRPRQPADQRYANAYIFGAICPARGVGAAIMMPTADTQAMQLHLEEISKMATKGAHAVVLMDQAGWHTTGGLTLPDNLSLLFLPPKSPELNPVENIWQYLRQTWLANRIFETYDNILDAGCKAWNNLVAQPELITSIGTRKWAKIGQTL